MKLDSWPDEIECDGWRWEVYYKAPLPNPAPPPPDNARHFYEITYRRTEKLHTPPTMREIMEHLLNGGWVGRFDRSLPGDYYFRIGTKGEFEECYKNRILKPSQWSNCDWIGRFNCTKHEWFLIQPNEWFEGGEK